MFVPASVSSYVFGRGSSVLPPLFDALETVGSDLSQFKCPKCGCHDRERHLFLYLSTTGIIERFNNAHILHFAPEEHLIPIIKAVNPIRYIRCDLFPKCPDDEKIDIMNIPYQNESFDILIANHLLEHVLDYETALREIHRVLKKGGLAILQTPFSRKLNNTMYDAGVNDDFSRSQLYGQNDHIRLFGSDIFRIIEEFGFISKVVSHKDVLFNIDANIYGVNQNEPFSLFQCK